MMMMMMTTLPSECRIDLAGAYHLVYKIMLMMNDDIDRGDDDKDYDDDNSGIGM